MKLKQKISGTSVFIIVPVPVFLFPKSLREFPFPIPAGNGTGKFGKKLFPQDPNVKTHII